MEPTELPSRTLLIFARLPVAGSVKTRLIPHLGAVGAAELQHSMTLGTLSVARSFQRENQVDMEVCFTGKSADLMAETYGQDLRFFAQGAGDLGKKLVRAFSRTFHRRASQVVVIGTDCPGLRTGHLQAAFEALDEVDLVLGPALDGGYYLLGLRQPQPALFAHISWGTDQVLNQTLEAGRRCGLAFKLLEELADVDRPEDLRHVPNQ